MPLIIREDTVWHGGQTINLKQDVQVAEGATLTIEDGVTVVGKGHSIVVWGGVEVGSADGAATTLKNVDLDFSENHSHTEVGGYLRMNNVDFLGGRFLEEGGYGHFDVSGSRFLKTEGFYIWYPTENSTFTGNLFDGTDKISVGLHNDTSLTIKDNAFVNNRGPAIENWAAYGGAETMIVSGNSFLSLKLVALSLEYGYTNAAMSGSGNYFGTLDPTEIQKRVLDANDDLNRGSTIDVSDPLSEPSAASPVFYDIKTSTAYGNAADNHLVTLTTDDTLFGFSGNDLINAGGGDDKLYAGAGTDLLIGGRDNDLLVGGTDADIFRFYGKFGRDNVTDFDAASEAHDFLDLSKLNGVDDFSDISGHMTQHGRSVWIDFDENRIVLRHTSVGDLDQSDFIL